MPTMSGFEVIKALNKKGNKIPVVVLSAMADKDYMLKARNLGINNYLTKPVRPAIVQLKACEILNKNL